MKRSQWFGWPKKRALQIINKATYSRNKCMKCDKPPQVDVRWANGWGRAWFCILHFLEWAQETEREIVRAWFVKDGQVPKKLQDGYDRPKLRGKGQRISPKKIADRAKELAHGG